MAGSPIRNSAPARGDSSTISLPRRRRLAKRDNTTVSLSPSFARCGQYSGIWGSMTTRTCSSRGKDRRYSSSPCRASRCTRSVDFPRDGALAGQGRERQAVGQISRAVHRGRAQLPQIDGIAVHEGSDAPVRLHLQGEMTVQSDGDDWRDLPGRLFPGSAHERPFQVCGRNGVSSLSGRGRSSSPSFSGTS